VKKFLLTLGFLFGLSRSAEAAWALTNAGIVAPGAHTGASATVTVTSTIPSGRLIIIPTTGRTNDNSATIAWSDSCGDTFSNHAIFYLNSVFFGTVAWVVTTCTLTNGVGTVTVTDNTGTFDSEIGFAVIGTTGGNTASPEDTAGYGSSSNYPAPGPDTNMSVTSGTPSQTGDLFIGVNINTDQTATYTEDTGPGWSPLFNQTSNGNCFNAGCNSADITNPAATTVTWNPIISSSVFSSRLIVAFKAAASATGQASPLTMLGVGN
jgi:hypothetical protein